MGGQVPTMPLSTTQALSAEQRQQIKDRFCNVYGTRHMGAPLFFGEQRAKQPVSQCCPNCGAPATRNVLHCEYCRTQFSDSTPGIDIYALCDFDPETERIEVTTLGDPVRRFIPAMQDEYFRK